MSKRLNKKPSSGGRRHMRAKAYRIESTWVIAGPGLWQMEQQLDEDTDLVTFTCPSCGERTLRYLIHGEEFNVKHARRCGLNASVAAALAQYPSCGVKSVRYVAPTSSAGECDLDGQALGGTLIVGADEEAIEHTQEDSGRVALRCRQCGAQVMAEVFPAAQHVTLVHERDCPRLKVLGTR